jgi:hypothetical protein
MSKRMLVLITVVVVLLACGPLTTPGPTQPVSTETAPPATPIRVDLTPAQLAAMQALASAQNIPVEQIQLVSTAAVEWPDGCLGVVLMGVLCTRGPVPGFRIVFSANGAQYEYHTNQDGSSVLLATGVSPYLRIAVRAADNSVQIVDTSIPLDPTNGPASHGFLPQGGVSGAAVYAFIFADRATVAAMDTSGTHPLDFVQSPSYGLAVYPEYVTGGSRLAWGTQYTSTQSRLLVSAPDGSQLETLIAEDIPPDLPHELVAQRWSSDGQSLYFSKEPVGIGGYIPFSGASSLYRINLSDRQITALIPFDESGHSMICLDAFSADERFVADHCTDGVITVRDLTTGQSTTIQPPADVTDFGLMGGAQFSPDGTRVAFALAQGDPNNEQGWVAVSDSLSGASSLVITGAPGQYFTVVAWLNASTLLLQSNALQCNPTCTDELWTVGIDGSNWLKVADGTFLTLVDGYQP